MKNRLSVSVAGDTVRIGPFSFSIQRTLRLPNDGKTYPLPPGLGAFPLCKVDDYKDKVPAAWREHGGVFFPMWQREAAWISFHGEQYDPVAVRVAAGKICAVTGEVWDDKLQSSPQNYMVVGGHRGQPWLDGFKTANGEVSQFVAMPLGMGYTVEKQLTGKEDVGGLQVAVFGCKTDKKPQRPPSSPLRSSSIRKAAYGAPGGQSLSCSTRGAGQGYGSGEVYGANAAGSMGFMSAEEVGQEMGLAAGGKMHQTITPDFLGFDCWDQETGGRVFVHIVNSQMYEQITGKKAPPSPVSAASYTKAGYPWYDHYGEGDVGTSSKLAGVKNVAAIDQEKGITGQQDDKTVVVPDSQVKKLGDPKVVRDGNW